MRKHDSDRAGQLFRENELFRENSSCFASRETTLVVSRVCQLFREFLSYLASHVDILLDVYRFFRDFFSYLARMAVVSRGIVSRE